MDDLISLRLRNHVYRFLSGIFLSVPPDETLRLIREVEFWEMSATYLAPAELAAFRSFVQGGQYTRENIRQQFHALFKVPAGFHVFPYESCHRSARFPGPLSGPHAAAVQRAYDEANLEVSADAGELPDHIGVELGFLADLSSGETEALQQANLDRAAELHGHRQDFARDHVLAWLPELVHRIEETGSSPFYTGCARLALRVTEQELDPPQERELHGFG